LRIIQEESMKDNTAAVHAQVPVEVAAFLLNVVVSRLVATQREQIAALKALGYENRSIAAHYLKLVGCIVLLGWVAVWFIGPIADGAGLTAVVLLIIGGVVYSVGGVFYGLKWPDPWPETFGHHEFFHACTAVAAICHYIAMWFAVF
jgi:channel protein (hemolysin III family)